MRRRSGIVLVVVLMAVLSNVVSAEDYADCMSRSRKDPDAALARAVSWEAAGGGLPARHCLASALLELGRLAEAADVLEELAAEHDGKPAARSSLLQQAAAARARAGQAGKALFLLGQARDLAPENATILEDRAVLLMSVGQLWEAADHLNVLLDLRPDYGPALVLRASVWRFLETPELARADLERALALDPNDPDALIERGILAYQSGNRSDARKDWMGVILQAPESVQAEAARAHLAGMDIGHIPES